MNQPTKPASICSKCGKDAEGGSSGGIAICWDCYTTTEIMPRAFERRSPPTKPASIKPCPKCNSEVIHLGGGKDYRFVNCPECMISNNLAAESMKFDKEAAIEDWNADRSPLPPSDEKPVKTHIPEIDYQHDLESKIEQLESQLSLANSQLEVARENLEWIKEVAINLGNDVYEKGTIYNQYLGIENHANLALSKLSEGGGEKA